MKRESREGSDKGKGRGGRGMSDKEVREERAEEGRGELRGEGRGGKGGG
jgi:hypothetical protein